MAAPAVRGRVGASSEGLRAVMADLPRHVALIMDGNGRWAEARGLARVRGHRAGVESVRAVTRHAAKLGLRQLTLFAFSTENWKRPRAEVSTLMRLLRRYLVEERGELMENDIRLAAIGRISGLPHRVQAALEETRELTRKNRGMTLCLALNYGGQLEIADAAKHLAVDVAAGRLSPEAIDEAALAARLYQPGMPQLDLLVRTAGEQRVSNFLLWQLSYAEIYVSDVCWPEFREEELETALAEYGRRVRRFGGLVPK
jgi:undecaprenyl diphosphate synthase